MTRTIPETTPLGIPVPSDEVAEENEECARIVDGILGKGNKISFFIRNRMAARTIAELTKK